MEVARYRIVSKGNIFIKTIAGSMPERFKSRIFYCLEEGKFDFCEMGREKSWNRVGELEGKLSRILKWL